MRILTLILATALCAGCQSSHVGATIAAAECKDKDNVDECKIVVSISESDCLPSVPVAQLTVGFKKNAKDKFIWWQINSDQQDKWFFASNGIAPKAVNKKEWDDNFDNAGRFERKSAFRWKNKNKDEQSGSEYRYEITVINADDKVCKLDPIIKNQM
jgi:hypothetical protein